ncbi:MAG: hypothetical protein WD535_06200 [Thermaerobacterales bacterium]
MRDASSQLDRSTLRRRLIILGVFFAFVIMLFTVSYSRIIAVTQWETRLNQAAPEEVVAVFLEARAEQNFSLKLLTLSQDVKERLTDDRFPDPRDRQVDSLLVHHAEPLTESEAAAARSSSLLETGQAYDEAVLVYGDYVITYRDGGPEPSGRYQDVFVVVRDEGQRWRIAGWQRQ